MGGANSHHTINIVAESIGPVVEVTPKEIDFGKIPVLKDVSQKIKIVNKSLIEADFHAFTKRKDSIFRPI